MKKVENIEYYRIANGRYADEGKLVVLSGRTGYNPERINTKNGIGEPITVNQFTKLFEKAATKPDMFKITKIKPVDDKGNNMYKVTMKDKDGLNHIVINILENVSKEHPELVSRYDNMRKENYTYRTTKNAKNIVKKGKGINIETVKKGAIIAFASIGLLTFVGAVNKLSKQAQMIENYYNNIEYYEQQRIDEKCSTEYNYNHDKDCLARQEGYASYKDKLKKEKEAIEKASKKINQETAYENTNTKAQTK